MIEIIKPTIFVFGVLIFVLMAIPVVAFNVAKALINIAIDDFKTAITRGPEWRVDLL